MARPPKPWIWAERKCWAATVRGKRRVLAEGTDAIARTAAVRELHRLLAMTGDAAEPPPGESASAGEILLRFHDHTRATLKPCTVNLYARRLREFREKWGDVPAEAIRPRHLSDWLGSRSWGPSTARTAAVIVCRGFAWAASQGYIARNPTAGFEMPRARRREAIPSREDVAKLMEAEMHPAFRDFLRAVWATGCRPGEACKVEAKDFDPDTGTWTIEGKTTRKTGKMRVVYLTPEVVGICRRLAAARPSGPLFRNTRGHPWRTRSYDKHLRKLRLRLGLGPEVVAYAFRHLWITDALERGVPIATVAELVGHSNTTIISRNYSHLSERSSHLRDSLGKIRPKEDD